jgi:hypothetical protein
MHDMNDYRLGSIAQPFKPLGPPTFEPGDRVRFKPPYMDRKVYTVSHVTGSGRRIARWDAEHRWLFTGHASQSRTTAARRWRTLIRLVVRMRRLRVE